jgi:hypothetical protein
MAARRRLTQVPPGDYTVGNKPVINPNTSRGLGEPMAVNREARPLKVCSTCRYWVYQYKGLCTRLNQGVGKFWICEDWQAIEESPLPAAPGSAAPGPPSP